MDKVRIEIHLTKEATKILDAIAKADGRSRKNFCEAEILKIVQAKEQSLKKVKNKPMRSTS